MFLPFILLVFYVVSQSCFAIEMNVTRNSLQDTFSVSNCSFLCVKFNHAICLIEEGVCQCPMVASTFFIYKQRCDSHSTLIKGHDCLSWPHGRNHLQMIDLAASSSSPFRTSYNSCSVPLGRTFKYLGPERGNWITHQLQGDGPVFVVERSKLTRRRRMVLKILGNNDLVSFAGGRIIRIDLLCKGSEGQAKSCLIFKAKGTISVTGSVNPSQGRMGSVPTIQHGDAGTTRAATSERMIRTETKEPTTPRTHYIGTQSKPHFTPTPSNSTSITYAHINGAVSVNKDKTNQKGDTVVVAIISVVGAIACVLVIGALFAWFVIKYYKGFRQQDQRNTPQSIVISNNQDVQNAIQMAGMTTAGRLSEPVYSELPDVVESANRNRSPTDISIPIENREDSFFIIRNPLQYNTLPRARKLTDPLPATPPDRSKTPDLRLTHRTTSTVDPNATKTAQFLFEVSKNLCVPVAQDLRRKRSSTDVDIDGVFFENIPAKGLIVDLVDGGEEKPKNNKTQSIYEDLSEASKQSGISVYEPLEKATLQPPDVRKTTLERINNQGSADDHFVCPEDDDSIPEYHVLEPSLEHEAHENFPTSDQLGLEKLDIDNKDSIGTLSVGTDIKSPYSPIMSEHRVQKGSNEDKDQGCSNQGLQSDAESTVDKKSSQASGKILKDDQGTRLSESKDGCSHGRNHCRGRTSEKIYLRPRAKSSEF